MQVDGSSPKSLGARGGVIMKDNVAPAPGQVGAVDIEAFSRNLARMVEDGGQALASYMNPREEGQVQAGLADEMTDMVKIARAQV